MDHSYEEIRRAAIDILAGREKTHYEPKQFTSLNVGVAEVLQRRDGTPRDQSRGDPHLSQNDDDIFLEVFWDLFRQGIITLGLDRHNNQFPWFRVSSMGKRILEHQEAYFFYDVSTYETVIRENIPDINDVTLVYLKEAMQAFLSGCVLSSSVMLGVAAEHSFNLMLEAVEQNATYQPEFQNVFGERIILRRLTKFSNILNQYRRDLPASVNEDLDTNFNGIIATIRNFRNESGHPSGKIISREQCYILLNLFIPYCRKIYQLKAFFSNQ